MKRVLEILAWMVVSFLAVLLGVGVATLTIEAIEQTKAEACFESKDEEICKEIRK